VNRFVQSTKQLATEWWDNLEL